MIHIGIDLHSRNMTLAAVNNNGELIAERKISNSPILLEQFFADLPRPVQAVVECTSFWFWLSDWYADQHIPLYLAHAKMLKAISYAKVKTDAVDARTLADLLRADLIPTAHQPPRSQRELRERTRARLRMIEHRRHLQSRLWHLAAKYNVIIDEVGWRYLDRVEHLLISRLPVAVHLETRLLIGQIRQVQHTNTTTRSNEEVVIRTPVASIRDHSQPTGSEMTIECDNQEITVTINGQEVIRPIDFFLLKDVIWHGNYQSFT